MTWLQSPSLQDAHEFLAEQAPQLGLNHHTLVMVGRFAVEYDGRAQSVLAPGDRILIVKSDGALLIHNPTGFKPVNWQPSGGLVSVRLEGATLVVESRRRSPPESVTLRVERVDLAGVVRLEEAAPLDLKGTEADLRDVLNANPDLIEPGFVPWAKERNTERGPMDLYGEDARGRRVIIEVKRIPAGITEATQLWRYVEKERKKRSVEVRGILVAPTVSERARLLLREHGLEFREISTAAVAPKAMRLSRRNQPTLGAYGGS